MNLAYKKQNLPNVKNICAQFMRNTQAVYNAFLNTENTYVKYPIDTLLLDDLSSSCNTHDLRRANNGVLLLGISYLMPEGERHTTYK